jgi:hypothetical protein
MIKKQQVSKDESAEILKALAPLVDSIAPVISKYQESNLPIIKRNQWMNFLIMISLILIVGILTYARIIEGSAATGLIGAIIGYVFGHIYSNKDKK